MVVKELVEGLGFQGPLHNTAEHDGGWGLVHEAIEHFAAEHSCILLK